LSESEIALARMRGVAALDAQREEAHRARANWMARPLWRRVGDVICGTLFLVGLFLIRLGWVFTTTERYRPFTRYTGEILEFGQLNHRATGRRRTPWHSVF
jgi:hypothetical protein